MDKCPVCNAKSSEKPTCHRCGTDLKQLTDIQARAQDRLDRAAAAYEKEDFEVMRQEALRACQLCWTPKAAATLALASLLTRRFHNALKHWSLATCSHRSHAGAWERSVTDGV